MSVLPSCSSGCRRTMGSSGNFARGSDCRLPEVITAPSAGLSLLGLLRYCVLTSATPRKSRCSTSITSGVLCVT